MSYTLTFEQAPAYLHVVVRGENSPASVRGYLRDVIGLCERRNCTRVLIEERLEGPHLPTFDAFEIATEVSRAAFALFHKIAYLDATAEDGAMRFVENVVVTRGLPVKVFRSPAEARVWLEDEAGNDAAMR